MVRFGMANSENSNLIIWHCFTVYISASSSSAHLTKLCLNQFFTFSSFSLFLSFTLFPSSCFFNLSYEPISSVQVSILLLLWTPELKPFFRNIPLLNHPWFVTLFTTSVSCHFPANFKSCQLHSSDFVSVFLCQSSFCN